MPYNIYGYFSAIKGRDIVSNYLVHVYLVFENRSDPTDFEPSS